MLSISLVGMENLMVLSIIFRTDMNSPCKLGYLLHATDFLCAVTRFAIRRVMLLEFSQYLENYLWPNFDPDKVSKFDILKITLPQLKSA